jgi:hypothetical protein
MRPEQFFHSTPFLRWTLVPVLVLFAISTPTLVRSWTVERAVLAGGMSAVALCYAATLIWPRRLRWGGRVVAGAVFATYVAYAVHEWFFSGNTFRLAEPRSAASPRNSLLGLLIIGMPCLIYAIRGSRDRAEALEYGDFDDPDDAIQALIDRGSDRSRPMAIDFCVVAPSEAAAQRVADAASQLGYSTHLVHDPEEQSWTCWCTRAMLATRETIIDVRREIDALSAPFEGRAVCWASVGNRDS